ncbi:MerR family transcriptional regulator [Terrisporobacter vanillatitrophus]|uniref:MerR family transcriptional regulator n=1 Tax=Terrisporobacter vanillatitrophus TaxID=3058402 RepID=UPI0033674727
MRTVKQSSNLKGISVRMIHHYDKIGLLKPTKLTEAGYRLYDDEALETLQQILFFKELAIPALSKELNERLKTKSNDNHEMLNNLKNKLEKVNKEIENILNAIRRGIVNNMLKDKLDELE